MSKQHARIIAHIIDAADEAFQVYSKNDHEVNVDDMTNMVFDVIVAHSELNDSSPRVGAKRLLQCVISRAVQLGALDRGMSIMEMVGHYDTIGLQHITCPAAFLRRLGHLLMAIDSPPSSLAAERTRRFFYLIYTAAAVYEDCIAREHSEVEDAADALIAAGVAEDDAHAHKVLMRVGNIVHGMHNVKVTTKGEPIND